MIYKEDDLVLATVKGIEGTTVFVELGDAKGTITLSEVSAGRIRNIREFINVGKKIVCKVLRVKEDHLELSLRRVTAKEREAVLEKHTKERTFRAILVPIFGDKTDQTLEKMAKDHDLAELLDKARDNPAILEKYVTKTHMESLSKILSEKREKDKEIKKTIVVKTHDDNGLEGIQSVLTTDKAEIRYLGSSRFSVTVKDKEFKTANTKMNVLLEELKDRAKKKHVILEVKE